MSLFHTEKIILAVAESGNQHSGVFADEMISEIFFGTVQG